MSGQARDRLGIPEGFVAGFVGRLVAVKRPQVFLDLLAGMPEVHGVVLGDGPLASRLVVPSNARMLGAVQDPAGLLAGLDVLVLPSRREGCPLVALEAFAAGVPVVGFDVPGVRDALREWGDGYLVPPAAGVPGLRAAVEQVMSIRDDARVSRARAGLERFEPRRVAQQLRERYLAARSACR